MGTRQRSDLSDTERRRSKRAMRVKETALFQIHDGGGGGGGGGFATYGGGGMRSLATALSLSPPTLPDADSQTRRVAVGARGRGDGRMSASVHTGAVPDGYMDSSSY